MPRIEHPHELQEEAAAAVVAAAVVVDAERKQLLVAASAQGIGPLQRRWRWPRPAGQRRWLSSRSWPSPVIKENQNRLRKVDAQCKKGFGVRFTNTKTLLSYPLTGALLKKNSTRRENCDSRAW